MWSYQLVFKRHHYKSIRKSGLFLHSHKKYVHYLHIYKIIITGDVSGGCTTHNVMHVSSWKNRIKIIPMTNDMWYEHVIFLALCNLHYPCRWLIFLYSTCRLFTSWNQKRFSRSTPLYFCSSSSYWLCSSLWFRIKLSSHKLQFEKRYMVTIIFIVL